MDMRNDAVIMVYAGQGGNGNPGGGGPHGLMILGREEQEFQLNMQRNRLQRLLSTTIFVCFFLLFLDGNSQQHRSRTSVPSLSDNWPYTSNTTDRIRELNYFQQLLVKERELHYPGLSIIEDNVTGVYKGEWSTIPKTEYEVDKSAHEVNRFVHPTFHPYFGSIPSGNSNLPASSDVATVSTGGIIWLILSEKVSPVDEVNSDIAYVVGQVIMHDKSLAMTVLPVQGVFLRRIGRLSLFGNMPEASVELTYASIGNESTTAVGPDEEGISHFEVSPLRYNPYANGNQRLRSGGGFNNGYPSREQCVYTLDMEVDRSKLKPGDVNSVGALNGFAGSDVCGLYWKANATFVEENFSVFYTKASGYAIIMAVLCLVQIYLLLKQLQQSSTQAAAAKVSLVTIGQQAIIDSYLCLLHLTTGIVAQHIFTLFATVSFFQLIIFSIFEMRFLLVIWKARRPQQFTEGWNVMRRELTTLYSRFYISLLVGLCFIYYGWQWLYLLVIVACSFWVPQIIHNVHREVRNPFDNTYVIGMSLTRMFLPLYLYGCPKNFLTAMPIFPLQYHPNLSIGLALWMLFQVVVLLLQRYWGPRFFIPAIFLPVKYNYERRMDSDQLSLLRVNQGDELDCVICMVELDIDARDYMIAPCDHIFHRPCLQEWMQVKMECPTCRSPLPEP